MTGADGCYKWTDLGPLPGSYYDVSEDVPAGWTPLTPTSHDFEMPPQSGASYSFTFVNQPPGQGCTPGFWRNIEAHADAWAGTGYDPDQSFNDVFLLTGTGHEVPDDPTLMEALWARGAPLGKLLRHGTAALLNAAHPDIGYPYDEATIITLVHNAMVSGNYEPLAENLKDANELFCPLG